MTSLFGTSAQEIHDRSTERYIKAKQCLRDGAHYSSWLVKELKNIVREYELKHKPQPIESTKPKYIGIPDSESSWLLRD